MGRWIGVDYGLKRIGLAISDPGELIAAPMETLPALRTATANAKLVQDWGVRNAGTGFVVGLPLNMDGTDSEQTRYSRIFAAELAKLGGPVELWDERLSTHQAERVMDQAEVPRSRRGQLRDALAAQAILQNFLNRRRETPHQ